MNDKPLAMITTKTLAKWLLLGLPATALWVIGGLSALSLLVGLGNGSVTPGTGSSSSSLALMWGFIVLCAGAGVVLGTASLFRPVSIRLLTFSALASFAFLFFSVLT